MIQTAALGLLFALAVAGAGGVLLYRRPAQCAASFLVCSAALTGVYGLLDLRSMALTQAAASVALSGLVLVIALRWFETKSRPVAAWRALCVVPLLALVLWALSRSTVQDLTAGPRLPVWAVSGSRLVAIGQEWIEHYAVLFFLMGALVLASLVSITYLSKHHTEPSSEGER